MQGWRTARPLAAALALTAVITACGKKDINPSNEVPGAVRWYAGVTVEQLMPAVEEIFEAANYRVEKVDKDGGQIETAWGPEFPGSRHGWRMTRWTERQRFIAVVSPSQFQTDQGEPLVNVLLRLHWEERPPGGRWHVKEEGGAASQSPLFQRFVRELDERAVKLGARRN